MSLVLRTSSPVLVRRPAMDFIGERGVTAPASSGAGAIAPSVAPAPLKPREKVAVSRGSARGSPSMCSPSTMGTPVPAPALPGSSMPSLSAM